MIDSFNRDVNYLRISLTPQCQLRCAYCRDSLDSEGLEGPSQGRVLELIEAAATCGITKIRFTGGEPLLRRDLAELSSGALQIKGIRQVCVTTNGLLLPQRAQELHAAGVSRVNISLDSLNPAVYARMTGGGDLARVLQGIEACVRTGFERVKINCVMMRGVNDEEIAEFVGFARRGIHVRFLEWMPIGSGARHSACYRSAGDVIPTIPGLIPSGFEGTAQMFRIPGGDGTVGFIRPMSGSFCGACSRIRITFDELLLPCLHGHEQISLRGKSGEDLVHLIRQGIGSKPEKHLLGSEDSGSSRGMCWIGG